jgi:hypothetical protein
LYRLGHHGWKLLNTKQISVRRSLTIALLALLCIGAGSSVLGQPAPPPDPFLNGYWFGDTNWISDDEPTIYTNVVLVPPWGILIDTTNLTPAFVNFPVVQDGYTNIDLLAGGIRITLIPTWATDDTNQMGSGPGSNAYLLAAGDFSTGNSNGLWIISIDAAGSNLSFSGVSNYTTNVFVSAPISWATNSIHLVGLAYDTTTNSQLYIDGSLAATGDPVSIVPATNTWTNGWYLGSDSAGYEQARAVFYEMDGFDSNLFDYIGYSEFFTGDWPYLTNDYYTWLAGQGGGFQFNSGGSGLSGLPPTNGFNTNYLNYYAFWLQASNVSTNCYVSIVSSLAGLGYSIITNADMSTTNWGVWQSNLLASNSITPAPPITITSNPLFFQGILLGYLGTNAYYPGPTNGAPEVITQPESLLVGPDSNATFSVVAVGATPLTCQWEFEGTAIPSATASSNTISSVQASNVGWYVAVISNSVGVVTSAVVTLTTSNSPPFILYEPSNQAAHLQGSPTFTVTPIGPPPMEYQWSFDGTNISQATNSYVIISNVGYINVGNYSVIVTNNYGAVTSSVATLNIGYITNGLLAYWRLNDESGSTAADSIGTNTLSLLPATNLPAWGTNYLTLNGVNQYGDAGSNALSTFGYSDMTMCAWVNQATNSLQAIGIEVLKSRSWAMGVGVYGCKPTAILRSRTETPRWHC